MIKWLNNQMTKWLGDRMTGSFVDDWPYGIFNNVKARDPVGSENWSLDKFKNIFVLKMKELVHYEWLDQLLIMNWPYVNHNMKSWS